MNIDEVLANWNADAALDFLYLCGEMFDLSIKPFKNNVEDKTRLCLEASFNYNGKYCKLKIESGPVAANLAMRDLANKLRDALKRIRDEQ